MKEKLPKKILNMIDIEYVNIVESIIKNDEFLKRKNYHHHENRSVYAHCLLVSVYSYHVAKKIGLDYKSAAIAGLLHDFYYKDWQKNRRKGPIYEAHGFTHAKEALENTKIHFENLLNKKIENAIVRHMFPLNFTPPLYLESWIICLIDKYCSLEVFKSPKELYKYVGLKKKIGEKNE